MYMQDQCQCSHSLKKCLFLKLPFFFFPLFQMYRSVYIDNFLKKVKKSSQEENARVLASLFAYTEKHVDQLVAQNVKPHEIQGFTKNVQLEAPWTEIVIHHMKTALYLDAGEYEEAFLSQKEVVQSLQRFMPNMTRWVLPVLYLFNNDLRLIATRADQDKEAAEGQRRKLEEAANVISKSFTYCITDRGPMMTSKKYGTYRMIGMLFRIYFKLKQQNLCKNILRAVKAADMPSLEQFPKSDRVTFRYYLGRLYFLEEDYVKAENELNLAFKECTKHHLKNKELILQTLLPVKLMKGMLPTKTLLSMFPQSRQIYSQLAIAVKKGDVKSFNIALTNSESTLIKQRTYFAVEKAESIALRQLFRKVFLVMGQNTRLPIAKFQQALNFEGMTIDIEEAEWMLANMIYKGYMKGYLSHEKMYLVLSKGDPFPPVCQVASQS